MSGALTTLLGGLKARRDDATGAAREDYRALVLRLAKNELQEADAPAAVEKILASAGVGEQKFVQDVERARLFALKVEIALQLDEHTAERDRTAADRKAAFDHYEAEAFRLKRAWAEAQHRAAQAEHRVAASREAFDYVVDHADEAAVERYEAAKLAARKTASAISHARDEQATMRPPKGVLAPGVGPEWQAVKEAGEALKQAEINAASSGGLFAAEGSSSTDAFAAERLALAEARRVYGERLLEVAQDLEPQLVELRKELEEAERALLEAAPRILIGGEA